MLRFMAYFDCRTRTQIPVLRKYYGELQRDPNLNPSQWNPNLNQSPAMEISHDTKFSLQDHSATTSMQEQRKAKDQTYLGYPFIPGCKQKYINGLGY